MKIIINGAMGRMGGVLAEAAERDGRFEIAARVDRVGGEGCLTDLNDYQGEADVVVDFSSHLGTDALLSYCEARNLPVVVATTGQTPEERRRIDEAAARIPVFFSANMSIGVALLAGLAQKAASVFPGADIEIVERHHNRKKDVPSGTALLLARRIQQARPDSTLVIGRHEDGQRKPGDIGIHSLRYGDEVGTHEIVISTGSETLTLTHQAHTRALFAEGALAAAAFLAGKVPGLYDMNDIIDGEARA